MNTVELRKYAAMRFAFWTDQLQKLLHCVVITPQTIGLPSSVVVAAARS
jgi:hypothetical protein